MFPFDIDDEELEEAEAEEETEPSEYEVDFATGRLTGRLLTGKEAVKQWVILALSVDRYAYNHYSWDYGSDLHTLIGQGSDHEYMESEAQRMIEDILSINEDIIGAEDFEVSIQGDRLTASFTLLTDYGDEEVAVYV